jgi:hypothetical protein
VHLYGAQIPDGSKDSAGFEMVCPGGVLAANAAVAAAGAASNAAWTVNTVIAKPYALAATIPVSGSYDDASGWWRVSLALADGRSAEATVEFQSAGGEAQKLCNPATTTTILARGSGMGSQGSATFDVAIGGVTWT